jgi:shikimate kinase
VSAARSDAKRSLALIGMRGSGKSSVGARVAERLGRPFVDLDLALAALAEREGESGEPASAGDLLARLGEARFRELEARALRELLEPAPCLVLATGGGVVLREDNRALLGRSSLCVWLRAEPALLAARIAADPQARPALLGTDPLSELTEILERRTPLYEELADRQVEVAGKELDAVAREVARLVEAPLA